MQKLPGALKDLTESQFDELIKGLAMGLSDVKLAQLLQDKNGWLLGVKQATLVKSINRWRKAHGQNALTISVAEKLTTARGGMRTHLDVMGEMQDMIETQRKRIAKLAGTEANMPSVLLESLSNEMRAMFVMLEKLGKLHLETGIIRRVKVGQIALDYEPDDEMAMHGAWTPELEAKYQVIAGEFTEVVER